MNDEIKMFIAGEEVVSDNEFTINEEMLSASSTILNNCYPKSWELTRDYVNNFYYPKDYSKFVLGKGNYTYGNDEYFPLEITSKNFINPNDVKYSTNNVQPFYINGFTIHAGETYTMSYKGGTNVSALYIKKKSDNSSLKTVYGAKRLTYTATTDELIYLDYYLANIPHDISYFQFETGSQETSYEPYNEAILSYDTNTEKEWQNLSIEGNTYQEVAAAITSKNLLCIDTITNTLGLTVTKINDSQIRINGTANATGTIHIGLINSTPLTSDAYTLSFRVVSGSASSNFTAQLPQSAGFGTLTLPAQLIGKTSTSENGRTLTLLYLNVTNLTQFVMLNLQIQLEKNSSATSFEAYYYTPPKPSPENESKLFNVGYQNLLSAPNDKETSSGNMVLTTNTSNVYTLKGSLTTAASLRGGQLLNDYVIETDDYLYLRNDKMPNGTIQVVGVNQNSSQIFASTINGANFFVNLSSWAGSTLRYLQFYCTANSSADMTMTPMIIKGLHAYSYIPKGKYGIELVNTNKNLTPPLLSGSFKGLTFTTDSNGVTTINGTSNASLEYYNYDVAGTVLKAGTYTLSSNLTGTFESNSSQILLRDTDNQNIATINLWLSSSKTFTITEDKTLKFYYFYSNANKTYNNNTISIQLEKDNATAYVPYKKNSQLFLLDNPLRAINGAQDELRVENGYLYIDRKVGSVIFDGVDNKFINKSGTTANIMLGTNIISDNKKATSHNDNMNLVSNYFPSLPVNSIYTTNVYGIGTRTDGSFNMGFKLNGSVTDVASGNTWLSTHNVEVNYELATPYTEELGKVNLCNSYEGVNNVYIGSGTNGHTVINYYWKNYDVLFAGIVKNSGDISLNPRYPHYCSLQILDYKTFLSESDTLDFVISNKTIAEAIQMIVDTVSGYGFVVGDINITHATDIIGAYSTLNKTAYDVLQYLANISGTRWRARFVDSDTMAIDFYDPELLPQANDIEYTKQYWEDNNIVDLTFNYGTRDYRNKQIVLSNEVYGSIDYTEVILSNGYSTSFITQNNIGTIKSITVGGVAKDFVTQEEKDLGIDADFYYTPGKNVLESSSSYPAGSQIVLTYIPLVKGRQIVYNDEEVTRIAVQTNTLGVISRYENRNDILSTNELEQIGETYIEYKGKPEVILTLTTKDIDLFNIGEITYFNSPIEDLTQKYMIKSKKTQYIISGNEKYLFYIYELTSSFNSEKAINYFDNQRNKAQGNIQEGESITRNIDINNSALIIWDNPTITEVSVSVDGDNTLNSVLNSPFIE